jgi:hypothetical protein
MTKPIDAIFLALLLVSGTTWAEWVQVSTNEVLDGYIDPETIRTDGDLRRVWQMQNYKQRQSDLYFSFRSRIEYDCKQERRRVLSASGHSGPMAGGTTLERVGEQSTWRDIPPESLSEIVLKIVCAR